MTNKNTLNDLKMADLLEENCVKVVEISFQLNILIES
jgi:hypothetical protein